MRPRQQIPGDGFHGYPAQASSTGPFTLPPLPYKDDALAPFVSANTLSFHYGKHHKAYVDNLNKLTEGKPFASQSLEDVVKNSAKAPGDAAIFNNAAQVWNHTFYWNSMKHGGGGAPTGKLHERIVADFGSFDALKTHLPTPRRRSSAAAGPGSCSTAASSRS